MRKFNGLVGLLLGLTIATGMTISAQATEISWSNASGGSWSDGASWTGGVAPGAGDTAQITLDGDYTVILDVDLSIASVELGGTSGTQTLSLTSRTMTVDAQFSIGTTGSTTASYSTINGTGNILVRGTLTLRQTAISIPTDIEGILVARSTCSFSDNFITHANTIVRLSYDSNWGTNLTITNGFTNNGLLEFLNGYYVVNVNLYTPSGPLVNSSTGTIDAISTAGGQSIVGELVNQGTINIESPFTITSSSVQSTNSGTINVTGGNLTITQSGTAPSFTNTGTMDINSGFVLDVNGGAFDHLSGSMTGSGTLDFNNVAVTYIPAIEWGGDIILAANSTMALPSVPWRNNITLSESILTITDSLIIENIHTSQYSTIDGTGNILVVDTLDLKYCNINVPIDIEGVLNSRSICAYTDAFITHENTHIRLIYDSSWGSDFTVTNGFTNNGFLEFLNGYYVVNVSIRTPSGPFVNSPTGTINANSTAGGQAIYGEFDNQGVFNIGWPFLITSTSAQSTNSGTINVTGGGLTITQSGTFPSFTTTGTMVLNNGLVLDVNGGAFNYPSGSFTGSGNLDFNNVAVTYIPAVEWAGDIILTANSSLTLPSIPWRNKITLSESDLTINDSLIIDYNNVSQYSTIDGTGNILVLDTLDLRYSNINVPIDIEGVLISRSICTYTDAFITHENTHIRLIYDSSWGSDFTVTNGFTNNGLLEFLNAYYVVNVSIRIPSGPFVNSPTGTINANSTAGGQAIYGEFDNQGVFNIGWPFLITSTSAQNINSGTINVTGGNLTLTQSGTAPSFTNTGTMVIDSGFVLDANGGAFDNQSTGTLAGNGTIDLTGSVTSFTNAGSINPGASPGALTITGMDMTQQSTSLINIEIGATTSGNFDSLAVVGNVTKAGNLNVDLYNGYFPSIGDSIPFLSATAVSGDFESLDLQVGGVVFDTVSSSDLVSLLCIQADNLDPTISLAPAQSFIADDSVQVDLWGASGDPEYPDTLLTFGYTADNDSLLVTIDTAGGVMTIKSDLSYSGTVELIVTVSDPGAASSSDTVTVTINPYVAVDDDDDTNLPNQFTLGQNYPNPFNPVTTIAYNVPSRSHVTIEIFNILGRKIKTLVNESKMAGEYAISWDGNDINGQNVSTGMYFYRIQAGDFIETKKMLLMK